MKTQEFFLDVGVEGCLMSKNPLEASDLLLGGHVTAYGHHFEKNLTVPDTNIGSST